MFDFVLFFFIYWWNVFRLLVKIAIIPSKSISIITLYCNRNKQTELIIIPGFSSSSFDRNYRTLFEYYEKKIDLSQFKKVHLIDFQDDKLFSIVKLHALFFKENQIINPMLENELYKKCAQIIHSKLEMNVKYTILGKSAGGGVAIYLANLIHNQVEKLLLFAPGVGHIDQDSKLKRNFNILNIVIGWNIEDTKVKYTNVWPKLKCLLPNKTIKFYNKDQNQYVDTQHEINSCFIKELY